MAEKPEKRRAASKESLFPIIILAAALIILSRHFNAQDLLPHASD